MQRYDAAYSTLATMKDLSIRHDCLRRLIIALCEKKRYGCLVNYPFIGDMLTDVQNILESRARAGDLLTHDYYDLLYSFYIKRKNFRKGKMGWKSI